jgi:hypothetical protein
MEMSKRIKYWLLDQILDEIRECEQAIEAHKVLAKNARSEEEAQVHYMHIPDLQDFIKALRELSDKVRKDEFNV